MSKKTDPSPDQTLATGDPGDETGRRYQYQWTYAAIICCMLLDDSADVAEVFCEHHEDILMKFKDGTFSGIQVKTRASDQSVWKFNDESVKKACKRFVLLERQFPNKFNSFKFLTNHPLHSDDNDQSINHVLACIKASESGTKLSDKQTAIIADWAKELECEPMIVVRALAKTEASDELPKLNDVMMRLCNTLALVWDKAKGLAHPALLRAAENLSRECSAASALAHANLLASYLPASQDAQTTELAARLKGKRMDASRVLAILQAGVNATSTLSTNPNGVTPPGSGSPDLLIKKVDAGGFSYVSRNSALDLRDKADYLALTWMQKLGNDEGLKRYDHVRSIVLSDAAASMEETKNGVQPFGVEMLRNLRGKIKARFSRNPDEFYDSREEHVEGFAYALTAECKIIWSNDRPWESD